MKVENSRSQENEACLGGGERGILSPQRKTSRSRPSWRISARRVFFALASAASLIVVYSVLRLNYYVRSAPQRGYVLYKELAVEQTALPDKDAWCNPLAVVMQWLRRVGTAVGTDEDLVNVTDAGQAIGAGGHVCNDNYLVTSACEPAPSPDLLRKVNDLLSAGDRRAALALKRSLRRKRRPTLTPDIFLILLTKSAPSYKSKRRQVREGWLLQARQRGWCDCRTEKACRLCKYVVSAEPNSTTYTWLHHFVVGGINLKPTLWHELTEEHLEYSDLLFYPGEDAYMRLTWKVLWTMEWMLAHYLFRYILFLDDDCFVQMPLVMSYIHSAPRQRLYAGRIAYVKPKVQRDHSSKWFVNTSIYDQKFYPPYPWGAGLFLSHDVAVTTVNSANDWLQHRDWFGIDDAFIGILLNESGIQATNIATIHPDAWQFKRCNGHNPKVEPMIVVAIDTLHMQRMVDLAKTNRSLCSILVRPSARQRRRHTKFSTVVAINLIMALIVVVVVVIIVAIKSDENIPHDSPAPRNSNRVLRTRVRM